MEEEGEISSNEIKKVPKISQIGSNWRNLRKNFPKTISPTTNENDTFSEISIYPSEWPFEKNQKSQILTHEDGVLEVTALQEGSTPGVRSKIPIFLEAGDYILTVIGHAEIGSTFFPWVADSSKVRLTPTIHIRTQEDATSVSFRVDSGGEIVFGVLSHRQKIGDKCYISSMHISSYEKSPHQSSKGNFYSFEYSDFIPHQNTILEESPDGILVRSKPISTPGAYVLVSTQASSVITLNVILSIAYPSIAFLYVADAKTGEELIKRNVIFESTEDSELGEPTELYSSFEIPEKVNKIRAGILFSTVSRPDEHLMKIQTLEICEYRPLNDYVSEAYVLSLDEENLKFEICQRQGTRFGLNLTRWIAVDGRTGQVNDDWLEYMEKPWTKLDEKLGRKAIDKPGAWGYLLTMKEIFEDAISKGHDSIAVFDDDFVFSNSFDHSFSKLTEFIGGSWDVIYLGASQWLWDEVKFSSEPFYAPDKNTNGSFAVIYRKTIFEEIVHKINQMQAPFDAGPLREIVMGKSLEKSFVAYPNLVIANVEKEGIRDSRNQKEFSKRFGWDLDNFPARFTEWSPYPTILLDTNEESSEEPNCFVTAVTTINRKEYLQNFIHDWVNTRDEEKNKTLIVADDGSTDGTLEWLCGDLEIPGTRLVVIRNDSLGIARQTNSILEFVSKMKNPPDAIYMCNDDIRFLQSGWDKDYFNAMRLSGFDHLVYFNPDWKKPSHRESSPRFSGLQSSCSAREAMGCFYTLTPSLISQIGFFDEHSFPVRGHSHVDYTIRACRCEANDTDFLYDIKNSNSMIGMVLRDGYKRTHRTLSVWERKATTSDVELSRREEIISEEGRIFVGKSW